MGKQIGMLPHQEQFILKNYKAMTIRAICAQLGVTEAVIRRFAFIEGLSTVGPKKKAFEERKVRVYAYVKRKHYAIAQEQLDELAKQYR